MEDNLELLTQAKQGDDRAKEKLIEQNLGLVWSVARRFAGRGYDIEDLFQLGCIGLIKCIDKFDMSFGVRFSTYAVPLIQGEIRRFLRDSGMVKVSRSLKEMYGRVEGYRQNILKTKGYEPEIEEIAAALSISPDDIVMAMEAPFEVDSLDLPGMCAGSKEYSQEIVDRISLIQMLERLSEQECQLIRLRYFEDMTQAETGNILGISQVQVSRQEKKIIEKLRKYA